MSSAATVRQTPFTATLSPSVSSWTNGAAIRMRTPLAEGALLITSPTCSMRPVNISVDEPIGAEPLFAPVDQRRREARQVRHRRNRAVSECVRRHVDTHVIDHVLGPGGLMQTRAALEQERQQLPFA